MSRVFLGSYCYFLFVRFGEDDYGFIVVFEGGFYGVYGGGFCRVIGNGR